MIRRRKEPTSTFRVFEALCRADDFRTGRQLQSELGLDVNHTSAALYSLKKYRAVEAIEGDGALWWFATPENDTRSKKLEERCPECRPRKPRRRNITKKEI